MRFTCWYISVPFSAKQQREMIKISGLKRTSVAKFPHSPILHYACGSMYVVRCFTTKKQQKQRIVPQLLYCFCQRTAQQLSNERSHFRGLSTESKFTKILHSPRFVSVSERVLISFCDLQKGFLPVYMRRTMDLSFRWSQKHCIS